MAFLGHFIFKQSKCWSNLSVPVSNWSIQRFSRFYSNQTTETNEVDNPLIQEATITQESRVTDTEPKTFEELFKNSAFVCLGNPKGKVVVGTIRKVVEDNLYIDFGWKFPCVCPRPSQGSGAFVRGKKVRIVIKELELATKFLGSNVEITLNEADCVLLGLHTHQSVIAGPKTDRRERMPRNPSGMPPPSEKSSVSISELIANEPEYSIHQETMEKGKE